jgi:GDP-L-fucose synthase
MPLPYQLAGKKIFVAGHRGMVGAALLRRLASEGAILLTAGRETLDLTQQADTQAWMQAHQPDAVIIAAAKVGGIFANNAQPADFLYDNLMIEANLIHAAFKTGVKKLLFLGSSCIYPRLAPQPMTEEALLTGPLEPTNEWYAIAKISGIKLCQAYRKQHGCDFISAMPTNLYGPGDNFHPTGSHVLPALIARLHQAKLEGRPDVTIWGSGRPMREFLYVDDLADALVFLLQRYSGDAHVNVGTGSEVSIAEAARLTAQAVGYRGDFVFDREKPDGAPRKLLDVSRLAALGWRASVGLEEGLVRAYQWFLDHQAEARGLSATP